MNKKNIISIILTCALTLSIFTFSGCGEKDPDPLEPMIYKSIPVKPDNETARGSIADTAIRYFYLVCNNQFELANELIDRTDLSICTPDILKELYSNVLNYKLNESNRIVAVNVNKNKATVTFINLEDNERSWDPVYDEESNPAPSWYGSTTPYLPTPNYATVYEIQDINEDGCIDETDMQWEDHPELNPDYEPPEPEYDSDEDDMNTTATGAKAITYKTTASSAKNSIVGDEESKVSEIDDKSKVSSDKSKVSSDKSKKDINEIDIIDNKDDISRVKEDISQDKNKEKDSKKDVLPDELHKEEELVGYKTYVMDIYITPYTSGFKIKLPSSMTTTTRLMIKVPDEMKIKVGDLELNKSMMNLDDFYVIDKLPKVEKFNVELENLLLGHSEKEIDLTKRVYYIYSNLVPTHDLKEQVIVYIKPALQTYYNDLFNDVQFEKSSFLSEYAYKGDDLQSIKFRYDKFQIEHIDNIEVDSRQNVTYSVRKIRFPLNNEDSYDELNINNFRVTSYYYVEVPVYISVDIKTIDDGKAELETKEIGGIMKLTKDENGKLYVWDMSDSLALLDY